MAVFRIEKTRDYTVMSNHHLRDKSLSLKAKGLLSLMLSLPEEWDYTTKGLARICKDGVDSICAGVRELEEHGYVIRQRVRNPNGQLGAIEYTILEQPRPPEPEKPERENPVLDNPEQAYEFCNRLFELERQFEGLTAEERLIQRKEKSGPILEAYWTWLNTIARPTGKLKDAVTYAQNQKAHLSAFLEHGEIEISNNQVEKGASR